MAETKCVTCIHFRPDSRAEYKQNGHCWRYPPTTIWITNEHGNSDWVRTPRTYVDGGVDTCGEHEDSADV